MRTFRRGALALGLLLTTIPALAADPATKPAVRKPPATKPTPRHQLIDHGPFVTATIGAQWPEHGMTNKAVAVRLTDEGLPDFSRPQQGGGGGGRSIFAKPETLGGILFDTDACRAAAGWTGGFVDFTKDWTGVRDANSVKLVGKQTFGTAVGPGWAKPGAAGVAAWKDPRPAGFGPLPADWLKYKGLHRQGEQVIFSYAVGGVDVLETHLRKRWLPTFKDDGLTTATRVIRVGKSDVPLRVLIADRAGATASVADGVASLDLPAGTAGDAAVTRIAAIGSFSPPTLLVGDAAGGPGRVALEIPAAKTPWQFSVHIWTGPADKTDALTAAAKEALKSPLNGGHWEPQSLELLVKGGPALWPQTITTAGKLGTPKPDAAYVVDTITLPDDNPWHSWMRPGGFDFFTSDPTKAAVCNWSGDVWVVSGITGDLKELKWKRFASGLYQPLGLRIVKDQIFVLGRDQVTKLVDLNDDGEADFYECFNNDVQVTPNFHEFAFDLQTDKDGNFYFAKAGPVRNGGRGFEQIAEHHGAILKVSPDGKTLERYATGFRAPNGIGVGPDGQMTAGDNEGTWVPKSRLAWVKPGGFYGVVDTAHRTPKPTDYDRPLCWFPKNVDNSSGGQAWVTSDKWGPFAGRLLHTSYGTCSLFLVLKEDVKGTPNATVQGGVVRFPLSFDSGIMRAKFNPADGQLYVAGLRGWQTSAGRDGCFQRVRYTGKPVNMPTELKATKAGLLITFTGPLNKEDANDASLYVVERWNYNWSEAYGSPDVSVDQANASKHDAVKVTAAELQPDGRTVLLRIADMKPAMQYKTEVNLTSADGADVRFEVYHTVHAVGE